MALSRTVDWLWSFAQDSAVFEERLLEHCSGNLFVQGVDLDSMVSWSAIVWHCASPAEYCIFQDIPVTSFEDGSSPENEDESEKVLKAVLKQDPLLTRHLRCPKCRYASGNGCRDSFGQGPSCILYKAVETKKRTPGTLGCAICRAANDHPMETNASGSFHTDSVKECIQHCNQHQTYRVEPYQPDIHQRGGACYLRDKCDWSMSRPEDSGTSRIWSERGLKVFGHPCATRDQTYWSYPPLTLVLLCLTYGIATYYLHLRLRDRIIYRVLFPMFIFEGICEAVLEAADLESFIFVYMPWRILAATFLSELWTYCKWLRRRLMAGFNGQDKWDELEKGLEAVDEG